MDETLTLDTLRQNLQNDYSSLSSWRRVGKIYGITAAMARLIAHGYSPGRRVRSQLGLPQLSTVIKITGGEVPNGSQVIGASCCACGQWFISNHPRRRKCFICSPYRRNINP
ncbi:MAG: hypothetical protein QMD04_10605 [Anaerolineales bacterium]|nr:hypothetical protein [Anaerolineales bacterium]